MALDPNKLNMYAANFDPFPILSQIQSQEAQTMAGAPTTPYSDMVNGAGRSKTPGGINPDYMKTLMAMAMQGQNQPVHYAPAAAPRAAQAVAPPMPMQMPAPNYIPPTSLGTLIRG